jgi:hypothetical protein
MRTKIILLLSLVFLVCTGACAGRQRPQSTVRTERPQPIVAPDREVQSTPAPSENDAISAPAMPDEVAATPPVVKKVARARSRSFQMQINLDARKVIEANNAWLRSVSERVYGTTVPPSLPANDDIVAALRITPDRPDQPSKAIAKATPVHVKSTKVSASSKTRVIAQSDAPARPLTPLPPKVQERESAAALAVLASPDPTALGVVSSAPIASSEAMPSVVSMTNMSARRSNVAILENDPSSAVPADSPPLSASAVSSTVSSPFFDLYLPAIIFATVLGPLLGYLYSRRRARVSSFDDYVVRDVVRDDAPSTATPVPAGPVPVLTREVLPPPRFPDGSGHHAAHSGDPSTAQIASSETNPPERSAPSEASSTVFVDLN